MYFFDSLLSHTPGVYDSDGGVHIETCTGIAMYVCMILDVYLHAAARLHVCWGLKIGMLVCILKYILLSIYTYIYREKEKERERQREREGETERERCPADTAGIALYRLFSTHTHTHTHTHSPGPAFYYLFAKQAISLPYRERGEAREKERV